MSKVLRRLWKEKGVGEYWDNAELEEKYQIAFESGRKTDNIDYLSSLWTNWEFCRIESQKRLVSAILRRIENDKNASRPINFIDVGDCVLVRSGDDWIPVSD